jgi:hypothetical protein
LFLHAEDPRWQPENPGDLIDALSAIELIGNVRGELDAHVFRAGNAFLNLIMFLGCSPHVELDPDTAPDGAQVCYVQVHNYSEIQFLSAGGRPPARCNRCRTPVEPVPELSADAVYQCPGCHASQALSQIDWRRAAGFGRSFIEVHGIFPQEAVPADKLLAALQTCSGCRWDYFYI